MKAERFLSDYKNTLAKNQTLKVAVLVLTAGILIQGFFTMYAMTRQRVVVVPSFLDRKFWVEGDRASEDYVVMMTKYAVDLLNSFTPETVEDRFQEFLRFVAPEYYHQVSAKLLADARDYTRLGVSQFFVPQRIDLAGKNKLFVTGIVRRWVQDKPVKQEQKRFKIIYRVVQGRFEVQAYEEVDVNKPLNQL